MASIRKTATGNWQAVWNTEEDGRRKQQTRNFATRAEAQRHADDVERRFEIRGVAAAPDLTVAALAERFLEWAAPRIRRTSVASYRRKLDYILPTLGKVRLSRLTPELLDSAYTQLLERGGDNGRRLDAVTVVSVHKVTARMLTMAWRWRLIGENPSKLVSPPALPRRRATAPTAAQIVQLIEAARPEPLAEILTVCVATGLRRGEALGLRWSDLDLDAGTLRVAQVVEMAAGSYGLRAGPKSSASSRVIGIDADLIALLRRWRARLMEQVLTLGLGWPAEDGLIFPDIRTGDLTRPRNPNVVSAAAAKAARRAGWPAGIAPLHGLRHAHATALMLRLPVKLISDRLGHANTRITQDFYQHPDRAAHRIAAQAAGDAFGAIVRQTGTKPRRG